MEVVGIKPNIITIDLVEAVILRILFRFFLVFKFGYLQKYIIN